MACRMSLIAVFVVCLSSCTRSRVSPPIGVAHAALDSAARAQAEREVLEAEHEWVRVTLKGDANAFASFIADGYAVLRSSGQFVDKATWVNAIRSGGTRYETVELRDLQVRFPRDDVAVVTGGYSQTGIADGRDNSRTGVYINTWIRVGSRWQVVSSGFVRSVVPSRP